MEFMHSMIRVTDLEAAKRFFCDGLGLIELRRVDNEGARFSLIFLATPKDAARTDGEVPMVELTYNWPAEDGQAERYTGGRNFGHLAYRVEDIYTSCQRMMDLGYIIHRPPHDGYMAFVKSPDGISVELLQRGERKAPAEPWVSMGNTGSW